MGADGGPLDHFGCCICSFEVKRMNWHLIQPYNFVVIVLTKLSLKELSLGSLFLNEASLALLKISF